MADAKTVIKAATNGVLSLFTMFHLPENYEQPISKSVLQSVDAELKNNIASV